MEVPGRDEGGRDSILPGRTSDPSDEGQIQHLLRDIERLADQLRKIRNATVEGRSTETQIRTLEASLRSKWEAVRSLRAKRSQPGGILSGSRPRLGRGPVER